MDYLTATHIVKNTLECHKDIKQVHIDILDDLAAIENHIIDYPVGWVDPPEISVSGQRSHEMEQWTLVYSILDKPDADSSNMDYVIDRCLTIARQCLYKFMEQRGSGGVIASERVRIELVSLHTPDNLTGWQVSIPISCTMAAETNGSFNDLPIFPPHFYIDNDVVEHSLDYIGWDNDISIYDKDGNEIVLDTTIEMYVIVRYTLGNLERWASMHYAPSRDSKSIPIKLNPFI